MNTNNFQERGNPMGKTVLKRWRIPLQRIRFDQITQPRADLDETHTEELVNELKAGRLFPPVVVFYDQGDYWLADGFHRYFAHQKAGHNKILADVFEGNKRDAIFHTVSANSTHGKRRTNADKRKAVLTLLKDNEWSRWTDRHIAGLCRVSQPFVSSIRKELTDNGYQFPKRRTATNGRKMNVTKIGPTQSQNPRKAKLPTKKPQPIAEKGVSLKNPEIASKQVSNDLQALKAEVAELKAALQERDGTIEILRAQICALESENAYSAAVA